MVRPSPPSGGMKNRQHQSTSGLGERKAGRVARNSLLEREDALGVPALIPYSQIIFPVLDYFVAMKKFSAECFEVGKICVAQSTTKLAFTLECRADRKNVVLGHEQLDFLLLSFSLESCPVYCFWG